MRNYKVNKAPDEIVLRHNKETEQIKLIKAENYTGTDAKKLLNEIYSVDVTVHRPFGNRVEEVMREIGVTKNHRGRVILDAPRAERLTGLNAEIFRRTMYKPDCTIAMSLVISICIGFKLSNELTRKLLDSAGLHIRLSNPDHLAYMFLLDHCRDLSISECNTVLERFGVPENRRLGSHGRGKNGESTEYRSKK